MRHPHHVFWLLSLVLLTGAVSSAAAQSENGLSPEQQRLLKKRGQLGQQVQKLRDQGKLSQAIETAEQMLNLERQHLGDGSAATYEILAGLYIAQEDFSAARRAQKKVVRLNGQVYGEDAWQTAEARLALDEVQLLSELSAEQRARLAVVPVPRQLPLLLADDKAPAETAPSMLLVGGVDFGAAPGGVRVAQNQDKQKRSLTRSAPRLGGLQLHSLSGARREVTAIKKMAREHLPQASLSLADGSEATEAHFRRQAPQHRYLHLATHGFFAPPEVESALETSESEDPRMQLQRGRREVTGFHPGLLPGIALAGANRGPQGNNPAAGRLGDDGILTALEVAALDLNEVELVVLSACETGLGEVAAGEGVLGLQRAFQSAGARSCVTSLWKVGDTATQLLMTEFYKNLWQKKLGRLEALRQAQLTMLKRYDPDSGQLRGFRVERSETSDRQGPLAPKHWAAFQLSGDWR